MPRPTIKAVRGTVVLLNSRSAEKLLIGRSGDESPPASTGRPRTTGSVDATDRGTETADAPLRRFSPGWSHRTSGGSATRASANSTPFRRQRLTRRRLLQASARAGVGIAGLALVGCADDAGSKPLSSDEVRATEPAQRAQPAATQPTNEAQRSNRSRRQRPSPSHAIDPPPVAAPVPAQPAARPDPATRVTHQFVGANEVDTWDPHRARTTFAQRVHSLTYQRILRPQRSSSLWLEPDLCGLPEILDPVTFVFQIDPRSRFPSDADEAGRPVTVEDVRRSIERLAWAGQVDVFRDARLQAAFDWNTLEFEAIEPFDGTQPFRLTQVAGLNFSLLLNGLIAGPFAWIAGADAIDQADARWPSGLDGDPVADGSGPYRLQSHRGRLTTFDRSEYWSAAPTPDVGWGWRDPRPARLDAIKMFSGTADDLLRGYAAGEIDLAGWPLDDEQVAALSQEFPEHNTYTMPGRRPLQLVTPRDLDPAGALSDPRIATAINWSVNRAQLERSEGGPVRLRASGPVAQHFTELALPDEELHDYPGYGSDDSAARAAAADLVGAAGGSEPAAPLKLVVLEEIERVLPRLGDAVFRMIRETSGLAIELEHATRTEARGRLEGGERFAYVQWGETPETPFPLQTWLRTLHSDGAENWGAFANPGLDQLRIDLLSEYDTEYAMNKTAGIQRALLSGSFTGWIHNLATPVQRVIVQPWFSPDARLLEFAWSDQHLADCGIRLRGGTGYPADRRPHRVSNQNQAES